MRSNILVKVVNSNPILYYSRTQYENTTFNIKTNVNSSNNTKVTVGENHTRPRCLVFQKSIACTGLSYPRLFYFLYSKPSYNRAMAPWRLLRVLGIAREYCKVRRRGLEGFISRNSRIQNAQKRAAARLPFRFTLCFFRCSHSSILGGQYTRPSYPNLL